MYSKVLREQFKDFYTHNEVLFALICAVEGEDILQSTIEECSNLMFNETVDSINSCKGESK